MQINTSTQSEESLAKDIHLPKNLWHFYMTLTIAFLVACFFAYLPVKSHDQYYVKENELLLRLNSVTYTKKGIKAINKKSHVSDFPKGLLIHLQIRLFIEADISGSLYWDVPNAGKKHTLLPAILDASWGKKPNVKICIIAIFFYKNQQFILKPWGARCIAWYIGQDIWIVEY